jgi:glycosyltransferase involved in cell wall biosynthesis
VRTAAISKSVADELLAAEVHPGRVVTIASAVDPKDQRPHRPRAAVRDELGARPDDFVVLALGALVRRKGFDLLLAAARKIQRRPLVWIAGEGPERDELERLIGGLAGRARLLGRRDDVPDLLDAADVVAVPSRAEGLGVAALEAMAAGRPVVAARVGGLAEVVVDERNGLLVPPEDPSALAAAIQRLEGDPALRARLGAAGLGRLSEGYLASQMVAAYEKLYREVLELHGRAGA